MHQYLTGRLLLNLRLVCYGVFNKILKFLKNTGFYIQVNKKYSTYKKLFSFEVQPNMCFNISFHLSLSKSYITEWQI